MVANVHYEGDALGQQEDMRQGKEVLLVLATKCQDSLEEAHDAKGKVQPSPMISLHSPTPIRLRPSS